MAEGKPRGGKSSRGKGKYFAAKGKRGGGGPPRGGDGRGDFQGNSMTQYRTQPLPEMLSAPGIVVSAVQGKESVAEREIMDALEEAADELYPETGAGATQEAAGADDEDDDDDIETMLKKELASMAAAPSKKSARFRLTKRETACVLYVIVLAPLDPLKLVNFILERCERTARCSFRFIQRLTPISAVGTARLDTLVDLAREVLPAGFATEDGRALKYAINTSTRNSSVLDRLDMIKAVAEEVPKLNPGHSVDLKAAERTILIELNKNVLGVSVVEDFDKYRKFNPARVAGDSAKAMDTKDEVTEGQTSDRSTAQRNTENRARRAAGLAAAAVSKDAAAPAGTKRKAEAEVEVEEGEVEKKEDIESGEVVEDETAQLGDDFEEVIEGGRATKVRRQE